MKKDPNADTEWNDVLRAKGIIPPKETEISEEDIINMVENTIEQKSQGKNSYRYNTQLDLWSYQLIAEKQ
jgi:hypothetical protein